MLEELESQWIIARSISLIKLVLLKQNMHDLNVVLQNLT